MSDVLFPELPGLEWELTKTPIFNTKIMTSINGCEQRASYQAIPKYNITMSFAFLRESKGRNELQQLEGFFIERRGAFDSFLYKMPDDNQFECTFVGDGSTTTYQIFKKMHSLHMPVSNTMQMTQPINPNMWNQVETKNMWDSNIEKPMWNNEMAGISKDGKYMLNTPLAVGEVVTVKGTFFYRCRFADDEQQYSNFMAKLWKAQKIELVGSLGVKV